MYEFVLTVAAAVAVGIAFGLFACLMYMILTGEY